jgi:membrane protease YdiL (CAAX protease family)
MFTSCRRREDSLVSAAAVPRRSTTFLAVAFALTFPTAMAWLYFLALGGAGHASFLQQLAYAAGKIVQFSFPLLFFALIVRRRLDWRLGGRSGLLLGLSFGLLVAAAILAGYFGWLRSSPLLLRAGERIRGKMGEFGVSAGPTFLALAAFLSVAHSFLEEYYWRWFIFGRLCTLAPVGVAMVVSSLGFMSHHVLIVWSYLPDNLLTGVLPASLAVAAGGLVWAWIYHRTGSLLATWLSHALVDAALFIVGWDLLRA